MTPERFKKQVADARNLVEIQKLIHIQLAGVIGNFQEVSDCLTAAMAKLDCLSEDGNEIGSRGEPSVLQNEQFSTL